MQHFYPNYNQVSGFSPGMPKRFFTFSSSTSLPSGLERYPSAPACFDLSRFSGVSKPVIINTFISEVPDLSLILRQASIPSIPGITRSIRINSGPNSTTLIPASKPSTAVFTRYPFFVRIWNRRSRIAESSLTIRILAPE